MSSSTVASSSARRRTFGGEQEPGLAEWTSKIRQMQQEVDDDVEAEQKRLAEEIARSRMERTRRRGTGTYVLSPEIQQELASDSDDMRDIVHKQQSQSDALRKLVSGEANSSSRSVSSPAASATSSRPEPMSLAQFMGGRASGPRLNKHAPQQDAADYTSFQQPRTSAHPVFGSRALNPTESEGFSVSQRAKQRTDTGIALPGLSTARPTTPATSSQSYTPSRTPEPTHMSDPATTRISESRNGISKPTTTYQHTKSQTPEPSYTHRSRTPEAAAEGITASSHTFSAARSIRSEVVVTSTPVRQQLESKSRPTTPAANREEATVVRASFTPRATTPSVQTSVAASRSDASSASATQLESSSAPTVSVAKGTPKSRPTTPHTPSARDEARSSTPARPFTPKSTSSPAPVSTPPPFRPASLARQVSPPAAVVPTTPPQGHAPSFLARPLAPGTMRPAQQIIPSTSAVSLAFLKPPKEKEPTPSLSRLKGRGFVEQRVKAAAALTDGTLKPVPASPVGEHGERKKSPLVDMWVKREDETKSPPASPVTASTPKVPGKLATPFLKAQQQVAPSSPGSSKPPAPAATSKPPPPPPTTAKPQASLASRPLPTAPAPALSKAPVPTPVSAPLPPKSPAPDKIFGSSHTTVSISDPGEAARTDQSPSVPGSRSGLNRQPSDSTPLTHLTKDRPKKRRGGTPAIDQAPPQSSRPVSGNLLGAPSFNDGASASDFDSVRVRRELIKQFPSPPATYGPATDELGRRPQLPQQAFYRAPPEEEPPDGASIAQSSDDANWDSRPPSSAFLTSMEAWTDHEPISVSEQSTKKSSADVQRGLGLGVPPVQVVSPGRGRALPGLTGGGSPFSSGGSSSGSGLDENGTERPLERKHPRIPSTGARATVMDVAQALRERHERENSVTSTTSAPDAEHVVSETSPTHELHVGGVLAAEEEEELAPRIDVRNSVALWEQQSGTSDSEQSSLGASHKSDTNGHSVHRGSSSDPVPDATTHAVAAPEQPTHAPPVVPIHAPTVPTARAQRPANAERRRSTYEKYSSIILPPLQEEVTPVNTPPATLGRTYNNNGASSVPAEPEAAIPPKDAIEPEAITAALDVALAQDSIEDAIPEERLITLEHEDGLLPPFNLNAIHATVPTYHPDESVQTLSVEVFTIEGSTSTPVRKPEHVLHETEIVAVVHRAKAHDTGLVSSKVWAWYGRAATPGDREEQKLQEFAKRFGTTLIRCPQGSESLELVHVLGGVFITRQGPRKHWSADNTAMHRVRSVGNAMFIDQLDLAIGDLCSGYSFCLSILGSLYVWHGRGALERERQQALSYANTMLLGEGTEIVEVNEGAEDEMFWAVLSEEPYANADYWQWRLDLPQITPRLFRIDSTKGKDAVKYVPNFAAREIVPTGVYVIDGVFELFVLVGGQARGQRTDIRLALYIAENISMAVGRHRPFDPVIHALVLPSQWPLDLKALFRDLDESAHYDGSVPEHMNVITYEEAHDHMSRHEWMSSELSDPHFLPLGVSPHMLS